MVGEGDLPGEPVDRYPTLAHQETIEGDGEFGMGRGRDFPVVGNLANVPQALDRIARLRHVAHLVVASGMFEHEDVFGNRRAGEPELARRGGQ